MPILFQQDWGRYPKADIHLETKNQSFIEICYLLEQLGVKNNLWPLALHNPDLKYVDPHSDHLSLEEKFLVTQECFENPWYWFRECARVPVEGSLVPTSVRATVGHMAMWWCYYNHVTTFVIMPRQCGKSVGMAVLDRGLLNYGLTNSSIHLLTKEDDLRRNDVERLKKFEKALPEYLRRTIEKKDPNNLEYIYLSANGNRYDTHVSRGDLDGAYKVGRGFTSANPRLDEFAYIKWLEASLTTIISTTNRAFKDAEINNSYYGILLSTTAGKKDTRDGAFAYKILTNSFPFTNAIYDCEDNADLRKMVMGGSTNGYAINCTFSHRQLGITDEEHNFNVQKAMISDDDANRDYFNIWTSGSIGSPLSNEQLDMIRASQKDTFHAEVGTNPERRYMTKWYVPHKVRDAILAEGNVVLTADTSDAAGKDEIGLHYIDLNTLEVLGSCTVNLTNIIEFSIYLFDRLMQYPKLTLIIERRSSGPAIIDQLLRMFKAVGQNAWRRIFNKIVQERNRFPAEYEQIKSSNKYAWSDLYTTHKSAFGFTTSGSGDYSRDVLYKQILQMAARHAADRVNDEKTINQIMSLTIVNNRIDHPKGQHDDCVISWLLGHWLAMHGTNLEFYGIDTTRLMENTMVAKQTKVLTSQDIEQAKLRRDIEELAETLSKIKDPMLALKLESRIKLLASKVVMDDNESFNVVDLMNKVRENKRFKSLNSENGRKSGFNPYQVQDRSEIIR